MDLSIFYADLDISQCGSLTNVKELSYHDIHDDKLPIKQVSAIDISADIHPSNLSYARSKESRKIIHCFIFDGANHAHTIRDN